jgi:hypothetical protein
MQASLLPLGYSPFGDRVIRWPGARRRLASAAAIEPVQHQRETGSQQALTSRTRCGPSDPWLTNASLRQKIVECSRRRPPRLRPPVNQLRETNQRRRETAGYHLWNRRRPGAPTGTRSTRETGREPSCCRGYGNSEARAVNHRAGKSLDKENWLLR